MTGDKEEGREDNNLTSQKLVRLFSPRKPRFHRRCAPLRVSLWRRMSAVATGNFILTGDTEKGREDNG